MSDASALKSAHYDDDWRRRTNLGNLESNLRFLDESGVLKRGGRILEIGSGHGVLLERLRARGHDVHGSDIDAERMARCRHLHGDSLPYTLIESSPRLPFEDNSFDVVMSFDVFEHIPETDEHLQEVTRVLEPGGRYVLQTPNKWTNSVFETIRWRSLTSWKEKHCSLHSYRRLIRRFDYHGYDVEFHRVPVVNDFFRRKIKRFLGKPGLLALPLLNPDRLPGPLRTNFFVEATHRH